MSIDDSAALAALLAYNALLAQRLMAEGLVDIDVLLTDLDRLRKLPGQHPRTRAVLDDQWEILMGVLGGGEDGPPQTIPADELEQMASSARGGGDTPPAGAGRAESPAQPHRRRAGHAGER